MWKFGTCSFNHWWAPTHWIIKTGCFKIQFWQSRSHIRIDASFSINLFKDQHYSIFVYLLLCLSSHSGAELLAISVLLCSWNLAGDSLPLLERWWDSSIERLPQGEPMWECWLLKVVDFTAVESISNSCIGFDLGRSLTCCNWPMVFSNCNNNIHIQYISTARALKSSPFKVNWHERCLLSN